MTIERFELDTDQWAVVSKGALQMVVNALRRDAEEGRAVRGEMADELMAAPRPEPVQQPDPWKPNGIEYDYSIHSNPDAKAWADFFVQTFPGLADKHDLMLGWFANAMMAMHDHLMKQPAPRPVPTSERTGPTGKTLWTATMPDRRKKKHPIPTSERLPTEADADPWNCVMWWDGICWAIDRWDLSGSQINDCGYSCWKPTGLQRPENP